MEGADSYRNLINRLLGKAQAGGDVILTLDAGLQEQAMDLLGGRRGAVVLLEPRTGAVLVLASSPGFDPNYLEDNWSGLLQDNRTPLVNRATQGHTARFYFKLVTARRGSVGRSGSPGYFLIVRASVWDVLS